MFGKLLKYEWKALAHTLLPLYAVTLIITAANCLMMQLRRPDMFITEILELATTRFADLLQVIILLLYFGVMVALFIVTFIVIVQRFYKGILGDEGYLILTAPVKSWQIPAAKCIMAMVFSVLSGVVAFVTIVMFAGPVEFITVLLQAEWGEVISVMNSVTWSWPLYGVELLLLMIFSGAVEIYNIYLAIMLGQLSNSHKLAFSFLWYVVINIVISIATWAFMVLGGGNIFSLFSSMETMSPVAFMHWMMLALIALCLVQLIPFVAGTNYLLKRKLNV